MKLIKRCVQGVCLCLALPAAALTGFGRWEALFTVWSHCFALLPGLPGDYLRAAYYRLTLRSSSLDVTISFGTFFAHPGATIERGVYTGAYCVIGQADIGARAHIGTHAQILSGGHQHARDADGNICSVDASSFRRIRIGASSWIGAGAIVMADVGARTTIGAGSIVTKEIPDGVVAVGNPARVLQAGRTSNA